MVRLSRCFDVNDAGAMVGPGFVVDAFKRDKSSKDRFLADTKYASKFYGCNTADFASTWNRAFGVPTGASASITYKV